MKPTNYSLKIDHFKAYYWFDKNLTGYFNFPVLDFVKPTFINKVIPFNFLKSSTSKDFWVHFFIDDYQFERIWSRPYDYINLLKQVNGVITPDFSMYRDMPKAIQIYNCYRNRAIARYLQDQGISIVPTVSWSDESSFEFCFDGIPKNSAVAISSNRCILDKQAKKYFLSGFNKMLNVINPEQIIFIGSVPNELKDNKAIVQFINYGSYINERSKIKHENKPNYN